jgi:N-methylhydantoinase A
MPVVNIHTVGAGGGSLAYEEGGGLRVGPQSAGADPGPACYGRGGTQPTVTDANVVLGRVDPSWFAGGQMTLDVDAAHRAVGALGEKLGLQTRELADGICAVANAKMAQAIRTLTVEKGIAPSDFALVAFGGAGPMHAAFLAAELEIPETIVPRFPGAFSAWGMLETEIRKDFARSFVQTLPALDGPALADALQEQEDEAYAALEAEGIDRATGRIEHHVDLRYIGQEYTLTIPVLTAGEPRGETFRADLQARFDTTHESRFGHANPGAPIEFVAARSTGLGDLGRIEPAALASDADGAEFPVQRTPVVFGGELVDTAVVRRDDLPVGVVIDGPAVVVESTATTVVPPGQRLTVDAFGALVLQTDPRS